MTGSDFSININQVIVKEVIGQKNYDMILKNTNMDKINFIDEGRSNDSSDGDQMEQVIKIDSVSNRMNIPEEFDKEIKGKKAKI